MRFLKALRGYPELRAPPEMYHPAQGIRGKAWAFPRVDAILDEVVNLRF
jgi:hypothetical protein